MLQGVDRRVLDGIRFYNCMLKLPDNRLVKKVFETSKAQAGSWANDIKNWLVDLGLETNWNTQSEVNLELTKVKLWANRQEHWKKRSVLQIKTKDIHNIQN